VSIEQLISRRNEIAQEILNANEGQRDLSGLVGPVLYLLENYGKEGSGRSPSNRFESPSLEISANFELLDKKTPRSSPAMDNPLYGFSMAAIDEANRNNPPAPDAFPYLKKNPKTLFVHELDGNGKIVKKLTLAAPLAGNIGVSYLNEVQIEKYYSTGGAQVEVLTRTGKKVVRRTLEDLPEKDLHEVTDLLLKCIDALKSSQVTPQTEE